MGSLARAALALIAALLCAAVLAAPAEAQPKPCRGWNPCPTASPTPTPPPPGVLRWRSFSGETPVLTLQPVDFPAAHMQALTEAAAEWNDTRYIRLLVAPSIPDDPATTDPPDCGYGCIPVVYEYSVALGMALTNWDAQGYFTDAWIGINPDTYYFARILAHELWHVLTGLDDINEATEPTIGGNWTILCPTPYDRGLMAARYPYDVGAVTVPPGYAYPLGAC